MADQSDGTTMTAVIAIMKKMTLLKAVKDMAAIPDNIKSIAAVIEDLKAASPTAAGAALGVLDLMIDGGAIAALGDVAGELRKLGESFASIGASAPAPAPAAPAPAAAVVAPAPAKPSHKAKPKAQVVAEAPAVTAPAQATTPKAAAPKAPEPKAAAPKAPEPKAAAPAPEKKLFGVALKSYNARMEREGTPTSEPSAAPQAAARVAQAAPSRPAPARAEPAQGSLPVNLPIRDPAVPLRESVTRDYLVCLEDGRRMKMLKRHLRTEYGLSPEQYRTRWGLPPEYPMVAPNYAKQKSRYAKSTGLGTSKMRQDVAAKRQPVNA